MTTHPQQLLMFYADCTFIQCPLRPFDLFIAMVVRLMHL